jgi:hypothetical protein
MESSTGGNNKAVAFGVELFGRCQHVILAKAHVVTKHGHGIERAVRNATTASSHHLQIMPPHFML